MNIFILHPSFPAQFLNIAPHLASNSQNDVRFLTEKILTPQRFEGVTLEILQHSQRLNDMTELTKSVFPLNRIAKPFARSMAVLDALGRLAKENLKPDIIIGHAGCGSLLYCKDMYPDVPVIGYFEWFQNIRKSRLNYLDETKRLNRISERTHHLVKLMSLELCDAGITPTQWQHSRYPEEYKSKIRVIHEGIDTKFCSPDPSDKRPGLVLDDIQLNLPEGTEIITYVARGFEYTRGFSQFMDAIRLVLERRPSAHAVVVGEDRVFYGVYPKGTTFLKQEKEKGGYPAERVHFVGKRERGDYQKILRASSCHVYLTVPFILSWSCLEAMSFACPMVGSKTPPVEEVIADGVNGLLADFNSPAQIAEKIEEHLDNPERAKKLGAAARETILERFELTKCLRTWEDLIRNLVC